MSTITVTVTPTYTTPQGFMREVSWRTPGGHFCFCIAGCAHDVRRDLERLTAEYGVLVVVRKPQPEAWK